MYRVESTPAFVSAICYWLIKMEESSSHGFCCISQQSWSPWESMKWKKKKTKLNWWHMTLCSYGTLQVYKSISNFTCTDAHMHTDGLSLWFNFTLNSSILRRYYNANQVCDSPNPYQHKLEIFSNTHTQTNKHFKTFIRIAQKQRHILIFPIHIQHEEENFYGYVTHANNQYEHL